MGPYHDLPEMDDDASGYNPPSNYVDMVNSLRSKGPDDDVADRAQADYEKQIWGDEL